MEHDVGNVQHNGSDKNSAGINSCLKELWALSLRVHSKVSEHFWLIVLIFFGGCGKSDKWKET